MELDTPAIRQFLNSRYPTQEEIYLAYVDRDNIKRLEENIDVGLWQYNRINEHINKLVTRATVHFKNILLKYIEESLQSQVDELILRDYRDVPQTLVFNIDISRESDFANVRQTFNERLITLNTFRDKTLEEFYKYLDREELIYLGW